MTFLEKIEIELFVVVILGIFLIITLLALIFNEKFRDSVLMSQSEGEIQTIGKVKGSFILLLFLAIIYIMYLIIGEYSSKPITLKNAIDHLQNSSDVEFSYSPNIKTGIIEVICNKNILCTLDLRKDMKLKKLNLVKGEGFNSWYLLQSKDTIKSLRLEGEFITYYDTINYNESNELDQFYQKPASGYAFNIKHTIPGTDLEFLIFDSEYKGISNGFPLYNFALKIFENGIEYPSTIKIRNSINSVINTTLNYNKLYYDKWKNNYHVYLGFGKKGKNQSNNEFQAWKLSAMIYSPNIIIENYD